MRPTTVAVSFLLLAAIAPAAEAQFAAVPAPPPRAVRPNQPAPGDSGSRTPRDSVRAVQRLDIQAWVDSAAGALARTPPANTTPPSSPSSPATPAPAATPKDSVARPRPPR